MDVRKVYIIILSAFLGNCKEPIVTPLPNHVPQMKGFSYTSFDANGFLLGSLHNSMGELKTQISNNWIALCVFEYQEHAYATVISPNTTGINPFNGHPWSTTSTEDDIRKGIHEARARQMSIMLKPQVDLYSGEWRAVIRPDIGGAWFVSYETMILKYARLAEELHVEMLCIGTEYIIATQHRYTSQWRSLISAVRKIYTGELVYAANWSGLFAYGMMSPEFEQIEFWNYLDDIGIDAYYPLTNSKDDSIPSYENGFVRALDAADKIGLFSSLQHRPVVITEIGIQSARGALSAPWDYSLGVAEGAVKDNRTQDFYYRVMIDAIGKQSWCNGMFWWNWESVPTASESTNYTPRNKPAAVTLQQWYTGVAF